MRANDLARFAFASARAHRLRSALTALGVGIGVTAVILLTSLGAGLHKYLLSEFTQFGTNIVAINPGRTMTFGAPSGIFNTIRPLTIDDAEALRRVPFVTAAVPVVQGNASIRANGRERRTTVTGIGSDAPAAFSFNVAIGEFLPADDPRAPRPLAVLGAKLADELFDDASPLGQKIRISGERYRVIGVMESKGTVLGLDLDDSVYIPPARGLSLFNRESLLEIDLLYDEIAAPEEVAAGIERLMKARHGGIDFTVTTQQQMLDVLGAVLNVVTFAVGAFGSISLLVGGIGIFTIMTISVRERTSEIGLMRAIGAFSTQIRNIFILESILLAALGGLGGLVVGTIIVKLLQAGLPGLPVSFSLPYAVGAEVLAVAIGLLAGVAPAHRASKMLPLEALRTE